VCGLSCLVLCVCHGLCLCIIRFVCVCVCVAVLCVGSDWELFMVCVLNVLLVVYFLILVCVACVVRCVLFCLFVCVGCVCIYILKALHASRPEASADSIKNNVCDDFRKQEETETSTGIQRGSRSFCQFDHG
jgi:hypothetical protein